MNSGISTINVCTKSNPSQYHPLPEQTQLGYIEAYMNQLIFHPPDRQLYRQLYRQRIDQHTQIPEWMKFIRTSDRNPITYFSIDPEISVENKEKAYILWSHGNSGDLISHYQTMDQWFTGMKKQIGIICYDYHGYGLSGGICSENNCYDSLIIVVKHVLDEMGIKPENLYLVGQSLGTGVVVDFCSRHEWSTPIILISPYKSISRVKIDPHWSNLSANVFVDNIDMFKTHHKMHLVECPCIIYHGLKDSLIHPSHSIELYNAHKNKITLILLRNADHNNILSHISIEQIADMIHRAPHKKITSC